MSSLVLELTDRAQCEFISAFTDRIGDVTEIGAPIFTSHVDNGQVFVVIAQQPGARRGQWRSIVGPGEGQVRALGDSTGEGHGAELRDDWGVRCDVNVGDSILGKMRHKPITMFH